jgi:hypothetical protein
MTGYGAGAKRKVVVAAGEARAADWLRGFKDQFVAPDPWLRRAVIYSAISLPKDERDFWLNWSSMGKTTL